MFTTLLLQNKFSLDFPSLLKIKRRRKIRKLYAFYRDFLLNLQINTKHVLHNMLVYFLLEKNTK